MFPTRRVARRLAPDAFDRSGHRRHVVVAGGGGELAFEATIFAGAVVTTLEAAVDRWLDADGQTSLGRCFSLAFKKLGRLAVA